MARIVPAHGIEVASIIIHLVNIEMSKHNELSTMSIDTTYYGINEGG